MLNGEKFAFEVGNQDFLLRFIILELFYELSLNKEGLSHLSKYC